ncbi:MAG: succinylglutamate desuccinylase/aspartoacylase family protein [Treponema sp.]|nr:succinylglutamate desuccinylase/aspartoacylase family protein [Treponema sp.]
MFFLCAAVLSQAGETAAGKGVTAERKLSDYMPLLRNSTYNTAVYVLDSGKAGMNVLIVGGTHGGERAGIIAADLLARHAVPEQGRLFVIPRLNRSSGRLLPLEVQGEDDGDRYFPPGSSTALPGYERRNINRAYPGAAEAGLTQKIALAVMNLLTVENIDLAIDLHETGTASNLAWHIIANPKNADIAAAAVFDLEEKNITMYMDISPEGMHGLSHKEWGDRTGANAFLVETSELAPLRTRTAVHLETIASLIACTGAVRGKFFTYTGVPDYAYPENDGPGQDLCLPGTFHFSPEGRK